MVDILMYLYSIFCLKCPMSLPAGFVGVCYLTSKEKRLSSSVTSLTRFTFRPCQPSCLFTWAPWQTPSLSAACWEMLQKTCRWALSPALCGVSRPSSDPLYKCLRSRVQGVLESFLGTAITGGVFCLLAGQPLTILSSTGPVLVFERLLFNFSKCVLPMSMFYSHRS